jgi:hypothetical protein
MTSWRGFVPSGHFDSEPMPASGADLAEQVLAGLWLTSTSLATAMWYRGPCQPERQQTHGRVFVILLCSSSKRCPKFFCVATKRIDFWGRPVGS